MSKEKMPIESSAKKTGRLHPAIPGVGSFLLMGLGQFINKSWLKGLCFLLLPILLCVIEFSSSNWGKYIQLQSGKYDEQIQSQVVDYGELAMAEDEMADTLGIETDEDDWSDFFGDSDEEYTDEEYSEEASDEEDWEAFFDEEYIEEEEVIPQYEYPRYDLSPNGEKYVIRDFGGFFTRGLWGMITLGRVVLDQEYAGKYMTLNSYTSRWLTADNSTVLLGNGLITLVVVIIYIILWVLCIVDAINDRKAINSEGIRETFTQFIKRIWSNAYVYIVLAPAFILILFFTLIPFLYTFILAFTNYTYKIKLGASLIQWAGFSAFGQAVTDPEWLSIFIKVFLWTIFWAIMSSFTVYGLGFINALVVESPMIKGKKIWRTVLILPWAIPSLISLMLFKNAFNKDGLVNNILWASNSMESVSNFLYHIGLQGKPDQPIFWFDPYYNGNLAKFCVLFVNLWLGCPYHMMMIIGVLATIPKDLYEAANIDGATGFQRFKAITLPSVLSATIPSLIMTFSFNFNNFGAIYFLTGGGPAWDPSKVPDTMRVLGSSLPGQTDILISWIYKLSFTKNTEMFNVAAVYSIFIFLIVGGFAVYNLMKSKSFSEDGE